jgi:hypothetical protein
MLHAGLDLSRKRLDVCLLSDQGELVEELTTFPDSGGLRALAQRVEAAREPVRAVIESMTGARFVHDTLERLGWEVEIADAQKVKGLAPLATKPTGSTPGYWSRMFCLVLRSRATDSPQVRRTCD